VWPTSKNAKEQKAKTLILKARIVNERDDFIHVLKDRRNVFKSENKTICQNGNVILQQFEYAGCSETIKSATLHRFRGDWISLLPFFACFRNCFTFFYLRAG
jgi:hypothetical protein